MSKFIQGLPTSAQSPLRVRGMSIVLSSPPGVTEAAGILKVIVLEVVAITVALKIVGPDFESIGVPTVTLG